MISLLKFLDLDWELARGYLRNDLDHIESAINQQWSSTFGIGNVLNVESGGTGTSEEFTKGSVIFAGVDGIYTQDNSNLFWDNTNNRLGIGTATPARALNLVSTGAISASVDSSGTGNNGGSAFLVQNTVAGTFFQITARSSTATGTTLGISRAGIVELLLNPTVTGVGAIGTLNAAPLALATNNVERMRILSTGEVGIGTTTPGIQTAVGRSYLTIKGSSARGVLELATGDADADLAGVGNIQWSDVNSVAGDKRAAIIFAQLDGATANNRGGALFFATKPNGVSVSVERIRIDSTGKVGIGVTANPTDQLTVQDGGTGGNTFSARYNSSNVALRWGIEQLSTVPWIGVNARQTAASNAQSFEFSSFASRIKFALSDPLFVFQTAAIGVAGNPITWVDAMSINSSGNIGVGTTTLPGTGTAGIVFGDGTALASMASNTAGLYGNDVGGTVKVFAIDEDGVTGQLAKLNAAPTAGRIPYCVSTGLHGDSTFLRWDDTNWRLDIRSNTTGDNPSIYLYPGSASTTPFTITTNNGSSTLDISRTGWDQSIKLSGSTGTTNYSGFRAAVNLEFRGEGTGTTLFTPANGGGEGIVIFGKRLSDSSTAVGCHTEFWPRTAQTSTVISAMAPGGGSTEWSVCKSGMVIVGGSETLLPSTGTCSIIFADGTVPATLASNTAGLYANDVSGTVNMYAINEAGEATRLSFPAPQTYAESNVTTDRTYDANATTLDEVADVLGTLIGDLRARGIVA